MLRKTHANRSLHGVPRRLLKWSTGSCAAFAVGAVYITVYIAANVVEEPQYLSPVDTPAASSHVSPSAQGPDDLASKLARREVQRSRSSIPDIEIVQVITEIPSGVESGWHTHPGEEVGYIIAGSIEMKVQGRETVIIGSGDGFLIPPRTPHNARDVGPETGQMLSTYIVRAGQPLSEFVDQMSLD